MCFLAIPGQARRLHGATKHSLPISDPRQRHRVEHAEGMERVALVLHARDGGVEEVEVEMRVVADEDGALAVVAAHCRADSRENMVERFLFRLGHPERMTDVDA